MTPKTMDIKGQGWIFEYVLHIKIIMSTNFQIIMLMLGTDYVGKKKTAIALAPCTDNLKS